MGYPLYFSWEGQNVIGVSYGHNIIETITNQEQLLPPIMHGDDNSFSMKVSKDNSISNKEMMAATKPHTKDLSSYEKMCITWCSLVASRLPLLLNNYIESYMEVSMRVDWNVRGWGQDIITCNQMSY